MSIQVTFAGTTYDIPTTGDEDFWGLDLTNYLVALANHSATGITLAAVGSAPNANAASLSGTTLNLQPASASFPGVVTTGAQSFAGNKTFTGSISASNLTGTNSGDVTVAAFGSTPNSAGLSLSSQVLTMQPASGAQPGGVSTAAQTFAGAKTFASSPVFSTSTHVRANRHSSSLSMTAGTTALVFSTEEYDTRNEYDPTTGIFTAAEAGYYRVSSTLTTNAWAAVAGDNKFIFLAKNGVQLQLGTNFTCETNTTEFVCFLLDTTLLLAPGDTLQIKVSGTQGTLPLYDGAGTGSNTFTVDRLF